MRLENNFFTLEKEFNLENIMKACLEGYKNDKKNLSEIALLAARDSSIMISSDSLDSFLFEYRSKINGYYSSAIATTLKMLFLYPLCFLCIPFIFLDLLCFDFIFKSLEDCYLKNQETIAALIIRDKPQNSLRMPSGMEFV